LRAAAALHAAGEYDRLEQAAALAESESDEPELSVLVAACEHLEMEVAYLSQFSRTQQLVQRVHGDAASFGLLPGVRVPFGNGYSQRILDGDLPHLVRDVGQDESLADLAPTVGAYIQVPICFSNKRFYGTLCCVSHAPVPGLGDGDLAFMRVLAGLLADELERGEIAREAQRHRNEAIAHGALFAALDARDSYTGSHSQSVVELAVEVTRELGMQESFVEEVREVALLHDIGKLGIPDSILHKPGPLDDGEWELMRTHPAIGARIVASIEALSQFAPAIRAEHERYDGTGYPDGLAREEIPLASRITFACDAYHAMMSSRPYRITGLTPERAAAELRDNAGTQFDPDVIAVLLNVV
jgi:GAF domain-containing protein